MSQLNYLIWGLVDPAFSKPTNTPPGGLNYKTRLISRLHPMIEMTKGEVMEVIRFGHYQSSDQTFQDPMLKVNFQWERNGAGTLIARHDERRWAIEPSTTENPLYDESYIKTGEPKVYTPEMADRADERRRRNIVAALKSQAADFNATVPNQKMFDTLATQLFSYIESGSPALIDAIGGYVDPDSIPWLEAQVPGFPDGVDVRQAIMAQLTI